MILKGCSDLSTENRLSSYKHKNKDLNKFILIFFINQQLEANRRGAAAFCPQGFFQAALDPILTGYELCLKAQALFANRHKVRGGFTFPF
ncbi:MAG: hypothetical protein Q7T02_00995 [Pseudomonas sp.]|nr:hypothetical protein [Pseudomonas sp.]